METWNITFDPNIFLGIIAGVVVLWVLWKFLKTLLKIAALTIVGCAILVCVLNWREILVWVKKQLPDEIPLSELQEAYDLSTTTGKPSEPATTAKQDQPTAE